MNAQFTGAYLHDVTTDTGYVESDLSGRHPFPVSIPYGHTVYGNLLARNVGDTPVKMRILAEVIDPDGVIRHSLWTSISTVNPEVFMASAQFPHTMLDKAATWVLRGVIEDDLGNLLDERQWNAITVIDTGDGEIHVCPYCGATFSTYEELISHIEEEHPGEEIPGPPDKERYLKWALIGGGIVLVAAFVVRPLIRGLKK